MLAPHRQGLPAGAGDGILGATDAASSRAAGERRMAQRAIRPGIVAAAALLGLASLFSQAWVRPGWAQSGPAPAAPHGQPPLELARDGFLYAGGHFVTIDGREYMKGQIYAEFRIPAHQTHPYPVVMVHGGSMSGTNYTGTPDGREGWAQYFVRRGYAVYVIDQVGRGRSAYLPEFFGPAALVDRQNSQTRYVQQEKYNLWPQAHLHTQWPGSGDQNDPNVEQLVASQLPAITDYDEQQILNRDALLALLQKIGPAVLMVHSQAGAFAWPVADARPDLVKAIIGVEPNGPPVHDIEFLGAPDWFRDNPKVKAAGLGSDPLTYAPPVAAGDKLAFVREDKPDGPGLATCWLQQAPARSLPNLRMPILVLSSEASYHAPYDHCTVKYLRQAGLHPSFIRLAELGIHGNSHMMMVEKNNQQIAGVMVDWLNKAVPGK
jgi:pimeloyl-ACP methyl ester carboxylesterase